MVSFQHLPLPTDWALSTMAPIGFVESWQARVPFEQRSFRLLTFLVELMALGVVSLDGVSLHLRLVGEKHKRFDLEAASSVLLLPVHRGWGVQVQHDSVVVVMIDCCCLKNDCVGSCSSVNEKEEQQAKRRTERQPERSQRATAWSKVLLSKQVKYIHVESYEQQCHCIHVYSTFQVLPPTNVTFHWMDK